MSVTNNKHGSRKLILSLLAASFIGIILKTIIGIYDLNDINQQIIRAIDNQCAEKEECYIFLSEITNFEWDMVSIYIMGGNWAETNEALGLTSDKTELQDGIVFSNNGKIVKISTSSYDFTSNTHPQLSYWIERIESDPYYKSYSYEAILLAKKIKLDDGGYRYILIAE